MSNYRAPKGLKQAGKALWKDVSSGYTLRPDERRVLEAACKTADLIDHLEASLVGQPATVTGSKGQEVAHPLIAEVRMQRVAFAGLLKALRLPDEGSYEGRNQQRDAAVSRWAQAYGK
ncbi:hypothetical protein H9633_12850 [Microbacterium sp. Re1]|uniref:P27 family phage terminase small subunit n=1 Tax=Microbacterium commune TaxID=2762219 RepID=A0ABR8W833_9MICO|nr:hypothetical protein [Microbacterium commune]MBD8013174.1 hypothetical protein [Microbacterium commune]